MIQGSFPRLTEPIKYEERGDRKIILSLMVHLYNFQTSQVGINQILNSFCEKNTHFNHDEIQPDANYML